MNRNASRPHPHDDPRGAPGSGDRSTAASLGHDARARADRGTSVPPSGNGRRATLVAAFCGLCLWSLAAAQTGLGSAEAQPVPGHYRLETTRFPGQTLPGGWVAIGDWTVNNGLSTPPTGGFETYAVWNRETALENTLLEGWFVLSDPHTTLGLVRRDISRPSTRADVAGSLGLLDAGAGTLAIHGAWDGVNPSPALVSAPVPFELRPGREYRMALWKTDAGHHGLGLWDTVTGESVTIAATRTLGVDPGKQLDAPGFVFLRGAARITRMDFSTAFPRRPRLMVFGDSNSEGEALKPDYEERYCKLAARALGGSCVLASRGRDTMRSLLGRLDTDLDRFDPEYVLLLLGTSEASYEEWRDHLPAVLARIEARGAVPVLATIPPAEHRVPFNQQINDHVRSSGRPYVDFARTLGRDPEGLYWDFGLQVDQIHPNVPGYRRMYERLRADVPAIFEVQGAGWRQVRVGSAEAAAGGTLNLPLEIAGDGRETRLALSLAIDPAYLRLDAIHPGPDLPAAAHLDVAANQASLGQWGLTLTLPAGTCLNAGTQSVLQLRLTATTRPPGPSTHVRIRDNPTPRHLLGFGVEDYLEGEVRFPTVDRTAGHWPLDGTTDDASGRGQHGSRDGGVFVPGRVGQALELDGVDDQVAIPDWTVAQSSSGMSVAGWVRSHDLTGTRTILDCPTAGGGRITLRLRDAAYEFGWEADGGEALASSPAPPRDLGRWVHVAGVFTGSEWRLYRAGALVSTTSHTGSPVTIVPHAALGSRAGPSGEHFAGALDEVRVFDRPLAAWEVETLAGADPPPVGTDEVWLEDALPPGVPGYGHGGDTGEWVESGPAPVSGQRALLAPASPGMHGYYFANHPGGWPIATGDRLVAYVRIHPEHPPRMVLLQWQDDAGSWDHRAFWGEALWPYGLDTTLARHPMGPLPPAGVWTRLEIPAAWVGLEGRRVHGLGIAAYDGSAAWDHLGVRRAASDRTWLGDALPPGAAPDSPGSWVWEPDDHPPFLGLPVHGAPPADGLRRHAFTAPAPGWPVPADGSLFVWVRLEPGEEPDMIALGWRDEAGTEEHRAYWGEDRLDRGTADGPGRRRIGPLPIPGRWTRLSVPAGLVELAGRTVTGMEFIEVNGSARWARAGVAVPGSTIEEPRLLPDLKVGAAGVRVGIVLQNSGTLRLEVADALAGWRPLPEVPGAAGLNHLADPTPLSATRYYRVWFEPGGGADGE